MELRTVANAPGVYIQANETHTNLDSLDKAINALRTARGWLNREIGKKEASK